MQLSEGKKLEKIIGRKKQLIKIQMNKILWKLRY